MAKAFELDPDFVEAKILKDRLEVVTQFVKKVEEDEMGILLRKVIGYYIDGAASLAITSFRQYLNNNQENAKVLALAKMVAKEENQPWDWSPDGMDVEPVTEKLHEAEGLWLGEKYPEMARKCQEILQLEPNNVKGLLLLGTAHFAMKSGAKAVKAWEKARRLGIQANTFTPKELKQLDETIQRAKSGRGRP